MAHTEPSAQTWPDSAFSSRPFTASTTSPLRRPERAAGLPFATAATVSPPSADRCSQAPDHADERDMPAHECAPAFAAVAELLLFPSHADAGSDAAIAKAATKGTTILRFIVPPSGRVRDQAL